MTDKMITILEKPIKCNRCPMYEFVNDGVLCRLNFEWIADKEGKIKKCPLRPLPKKMKQRATDGAIDLIYSTGYNKCLEEITGETE